MIDFSLTDDQKQMVDMVREFGREVLGPAEIAVDAMDPESAYQSPEFRDSLAKAYELGFHKMSIPEELGGLGLPPQTSGMVWEEMARWAPGFAATLIPAAIAPQLISFLAPTNKELVDRYVVPFCEDTKAEIISAWGSSEPEVGSDGKNYGDKRVRHLSCAKREGKCYKLTGAKSDFLSNGGIAAVYIIFANVHPEMGIPGSGTFVVPADAPGLSVGRCLDKIGLRVLNQSSVFMEDVEIPENYMIFPPGENYPMLHNAIITIGNLGVGYIATGLMRAAFEDALEHARQRVQWGKPIIEHQLIAEKMAALWQAIETSRYFLWKGSWHATRAFPGDQKTSLAAKVYATDQAVKHTAEMVQVFGGYGISKEYRVEKYARDAHLLKIMDGANETLTVKVAHLLAEQC